MIPAIIAVGGMAIGAGLAYAGQREAAGAAKDASRAQLQGIREQIEAQREIAEAERAERKAIREAEKQEKKELAKLTQETTLSTYQAGKVSDAAAQAFGTFANNFVQDMGFNAQLNINAEARALGVEPPSADISTLSNFANNNRIQTQERQEKSDEESLETLNQVLGG